MPWENPSRPTPNPPKPNPWEHTPKPPPHCKSGSYSINGKVCVVKCDHDRPGGDYGALRTDNFEQCLEKCAADKQCQSADYVKQTGYCYLKKNRKNLIQKHGVDNVDCHDLPSSLKTSKMPPQPTLPVCKSGPITISGRPCTVACGEDRWGGDVDSKWVGSTEACQKACALNKACVSAQYLKTNGWCYFKGVRESLTPNKNVDTIDCEDAPKGWVGQNNPWQ